MKTPSISLSRHEIFNSPDQVCICLGSCFAEHFDVLLRSYYLRSYHNQQSCTHYNPASLYLILQRMLNNIPVTEDDVYRSNYLFTASEIYTTPILRGLYSATVAGVIAEAAERQEELKDRLKAADIVILTLGTTDVLVMNETGMIQCAANHISSDKYHFRSLSVEETQKYIEGIYDTLILLRSGRPVTLICTISPQRYFWHSWVTGAEPQTDQFVSNQLSKSKLRVAVQTLVNSHDHAHYFPAYEITIDELRWIEPLYGGGDFVHVGAETPPYILQHFVETFFSDELLDYIELLKKGLYIQKHRHRVPHLIEPLLELADRYKDEIYHKYVDSELAIGCFVELVKIYIQLGFLEQAKEVVSTYCNSAKEVTSFRLAVLSFLSKLTYTEQNAQTVISWEELST